MSIAVVYLQWNPAGQEPVDRFLKSYYSHNAGVEHDLVILPRDKGTDIAAYLGTAMRLNHVYLCFLNSYSEILADDWLKIMAAYRLNRLVGATGSWETMDMPGWKPFPNPHIRTTGFLISRRAFLDMNLPVPQSKEECYDTESGPNSMTVQTLKWDLACVVGRDGVCYGPRDWKRSGTYRQGEQENLLIADNHTRQYQSAGLEERKKLRELAWGKDAG